MGVVKCDFHYKEVILIRKDPSPGNIRRMSYIPLYCYAVRMSDCTQQKNNERILLLNMRRTNFMWILLKKDLLR